MLSKAMVVVAWSTVSARQHRMSGRRRDARRKSVTISPELSQSQNRIYLHDTVILAQALLRARGRRATSCSRMPRFAASSLRRPPRASEDKLMHNPALDLRPAFYLMAKPRNNLRTVQYGQQLQQGEKDRHQVLKDFSKLLDDQ
ncbi:hypothetical protein ZEAMMB73_Zm00001d006545, partial [Zea mays]